MPPPSAPSKQHLFIHVFVHINSFHSWEVQILKRAFVFDLL